MEWDPTQAFETRMRWQLEQTLIAKRHVESDLTMSRAEKRRAMRDAREAFSRLGQSIEWAYGEVAIGVPTPKRQSTAQISAAARRRVAHRIDDALHADCFFDDRQSLVVVLTREDGEELLAAMRSANAGHLRPLLVPSATGRKGDAATKDEALTKGLELIEFLRYRDPSRPLIRTMEDVAKAFKLSVSTVRKIVSEPGRRPMIEHLDERLERARAAGCLMRRLPDDAGIERIFQATGLTDVEDGDAAQPEAVIDEALRQDWRTGHEAAMNDLYRLACRLADPNVALEMANEYESSRKAQKTTQRRAAVTRSKVRRGRKSPSR